MNENIIELEDKILEIINTGINSDGFLDITKDTVLTDGVIDSLDIMHFINDMEHTFEVQIYGRETGLTKEDCTNIHTMAKYVQKKLDEKANI